MQYDYLKIKEIVSNFENDKHKLFEILQKIYSSRLQLTSDNLKFVAEELDISSAHVFGVCSFYSFLNNQALGEVVVRVCKTISCSMAGKRQIIKKLENYFNIKIGQTTKNGKVSLLETNCLGACHKGPVLMINETIYEQVTPDSIIQIFEEYRKK